MIMKFCTIHFPMGIYILVSTVVSRLMPNVAEEQYDVIVVGAGFAGLGAASKLEGEGQKVLVLEATDWIGGQI